MSLRKSKSVDKTTKASTSATAARQRRQRKAGASSIALAGSVSVRGTDMLPPKKRIAACVEASSGEDTFESKSSPAPQKRKVNSSTQMRYEPKIPMSKDEASAWRREQRRVRNRESAAASRAKIRGRIGELENEVNEWKMKYKDSMARILDLESALRKAAHKTRNTGSSQGAQTFMISPDTSPALSPLIAAPSIPRSSSSIVFSDEESKDPIMCSGQGQEAEQQLTQATSRPAES